MKRNQLYATLCGLVALATLAVATKTLLDLVPVPVDGRWNAEYTVTGGKANVALVIRETKDGLEGTATWLIANSITLAYRVDGFRTGQEVTLTLKSGSPVTEELTFQGTRSGPRMATMSGTLFADTRAAPLPLRFSRSTAATP